MTFYEAALRVLEEAGKPLTHVEITQRSMEKNLLSHVGKMPELTMLARLAAMARRPRDRRVTVTAKDTFALTDWMLPEDAAALQATGVPETHPEEALPPLRPEERHPEPHGEFVRAIGRQAERERRRRDDDGKRRRFPPIAEVAFEALEAAPAGLTPQALLDGARQKELMGNELTTEQLLHALVEDNQRRMDAGRRPVFQWRKPEGAEAHLLVEAETGVPPEQIQQALCDAAGVTFADGRAQIRVREERAPTAPTGEELELQETARHAVKDARRATARLFRRRLAELELGTLEKAVVKLLHAEHFRELKVAKRSKDGLLLTARRKDGSLELRYAVRLLRGNASVERRHVQELRRDMGHHSAQLGLLCAPGDLRGDARSDALGNGALVFLWCAEALAEKFFDAEVGVRVKQAALYELDDAFFEAAQRDAEEARARREERHRERDHSDRHGTPAPAGDAPAGEGTPAPEAAADAGTPESDGAEGDEGDDEGDDDAPLAPGEQAQAGAGGAPGEPGGRRRRRRRRRRRGGRGDVPGQPGAQGQAGAPAEAAAPADAGAPAGAPPPAAPPPAAAPPPPSGGGEAS